MPGAPGVLMVSPPALLRNAARTQSEGRARCDGKSAASSEKGRARTQMRKERIRPKPWALLYGAAKVDASARWPLIEALHHPERARTAGEGMPISSGIMRPPQGVERRRA